MVSRGDRMNDFGLRDPVRMDPLHRESLSEGQRVASCGLAAWPPRGALPGPNGFGSAFRPSPPRAKATVRNRPQPLSALRASSSNNLPALPRLHKSRQLYTAGQLMAACHKGFACGGLRLLVC